MPVDSILISAAVVSVFAVFAGIVIWGDFQSGAMRRVPVTLSRSRQRRSL